MRLPVGRGGVCWRAGPVVGGEGRCALLGRSAKPCQRVPCLYLGEGQGGLMLYLACVRMARPWIPERVGEGRAGAWPNGEGLGAPRVAAGVPGRFLLGLLGGEPSYRSWLVYWLSMSLGGAYGCARYSMYLGTCDAVDILRPISLEEEMGRPSLLSPWPRWDMAVRGICGHTSRGRRMTRERLASGIGRDAFLENVNALPT